MLHAANVMAGNAHKNVFDGYLALSLRLFYGFANGDFCLADVGYHASGHATGTGCFAHAQYVNFAVLGQLPDNGANLGCSNVEAYDNIIF
jgi:hypothetical protein